MNNKILNKTKRVVAGLIAFAMIVTMLPTNLARAEETTVSYPYTMFASSDKEGAITINSSNFCVNGNIATNGSIVSSGNMNVNGVKKENAEEEMIYLFNKIDVAYFASDDVTSHSDNFSFEETNINISSPMEVAGKLSLDGYININTAIKSVEDIFLYGDTMNANNAVLFSKYGNLIINCANTNISGLIYVPFGNVEITAQNLNINNVVIIAETITINCGNVNANYSSNVGEFIGTVSENLSVPYEEYKYLDDTDEDRIPDLIEIQLGTLPENSDTDGDELEDGYEFFDTFTDLLNSDTDEDGVSDGEEDLDNDGLNNVGEQSLLTKPLDEDTDGDYLWDGDEVYFYYTDTTKVDTDNDGLNDGDEIYFGTEPVNPDTDGDGILDGNEKFLQSYVYEVDNGECAVEEVIISMNTSGNIYNTTDVKSVMNSDIICSDVAGLVGEPFSIETESQFESATISFKIDQSKLGDTEFKNLLFLWYDEDNHEFVELETTHDYENSTVSTVTNHFSRYMIVDSYKWFEAWSVEFDYNPNDVRNPYTYNTVLAVDCSGSMSSSDSITSNGGIDSPEDAVFSKTCKRISSVNSYLIFTDKDESENIYNAAVVLFDSSGKIVQSMTEDTYAIRLAMQKIYNNGGTSYNMAITQSINAFDEDSFLNDYTENRIFLLSDGGSTVSDSVLAYAKSKGIKIYTFGFGYEDEVLKYIADYTGGEVLKGFTSEELYELSAYDYMFDFDTTDTDKDGLYDAVEAAGIRLENGNIITLCDPTNPDSDGDGLLDGEEIEPNIKRKWNLELGKWEWYFVMNSNPLEKDGDYDGIDDGSDKNPNNNTFSGEMTSTEYTYDVSFNIDYREFFGDNEQYNKSLSILGSIFATLAYYDSRVTLNGGVDYEDNSYSGKLDEFYEVFGLVDTYDYKLSSYYEDDDISEMFVGHKLVSHDGEKKEIIVVSIRGTDGTVEEWSSNFDIGADIEEYWDVDNQEWDERENHKGFDVAANRLYGELKEYMKSNIDSNAEKVIFIVGHSRGAGIANILGTKFEDDPEYKSFVYTYASPGTTTADNCDSYTTIFNIINNDDLVTYLPLEEWGFDRYGQKVSLSVEAEYEYKPFSAKKGTWDLMFDDDYNYNGSLNETVSAFAEIADSREEYYCYSDEADTTYLYFCSSDVGVDKAVAQRIEKYGERISRYCLVTASSIEVYDKDLIVVAVKQTPAFFAMVMTDVLGSKYHDYTDGDVIVKRSMSGVGEDTFFGVETGFFVAEKYAKAKSFFIISGAENKSGYAEYINLGGMTHAHMPGTYYFMAKDYKNIWVE